MSDPDAGGPFKSLLGRAPDPGLESSLLADRTESEVAVVKRVSVYEPGWVRSSPSERAPLNEERLSPHDAALVGTYLENATVIMHTTDRTRDVLADNDERVVPLTIRTDGEYVWPGPVAYYVRNYAVAPQQEFTEYLRARNFEVRVPSEEEVREALEELGRKT